MSKRFAIVLVFMGALYCVPAAAQNYPSKLIRLVVGASAGSSIDVMARLVAPVLSKQLGQSVVVENHGGASQVIGNDVVARSPPDGYTLAVVSAAFTVSPSFYKLPYDPVKSFAPIAKLPSANMMLVVHPSVPVRSVQDLVALARRQPGKLNFAASGVGSFTHLGTELFKTMAGIDFMIVQYKSGGPATIDTLGGHMDASFGSLLQFLPYISGGKLRSLGTCGTTRSSLFPQIPTIAEAGLAGYDASSWMGILAPAGTPQAVIDRINKELSTGFASPDMQRRLREQGAEADNMTPGEFRAFIPSDIAKWARVIKEARIKVE
jgi:tripartite-type tricarboxylate transporter receptor subunit TctC